MAELGRRLQEVRMRLLVMGDQKGPSRFDLPGAEFHSLQDQQRLPLALAAVLPPCHYARKNLGYLLAIRDGASAIYETDDDNAPAANWRPYEANVSAQRVFESGWCNAYRLFTDEWIWPRGFPLRLAGEHVAPPTVAASPEVRASPIQQGLSDGSPDVDAVWRLLGDRDIRFKPRPSVRLAAGTWCPFNSQNTWWWPQAYTLMYLPSTCLFRMTDIWRSFIAQRCLWEMGHEVVFTAADTIQQRNTHDLMKDFADEIPGYLRNEELVNTLADLRLADGPQSAGENLMRCYDALTARSFFAGQEIPLVRAWLADVQG